MNKLTKEQVKAFIDDLAYIQHKHGIRIQCSHGGVAFESVEDDKDGPNVGASLDLGGWILDSWAGRKANFGTFEADVKSLDSRKMSAH